MADKKPNEIHVDMDTTPVYTERKRLLFFGLPWTFTKYTISPSLLTISQGFLSTTEDDCYMYKIQDVKLSKTLLERLFGLATLTCYTGDVTHHEVKLVHIKHSNEIKAYLLKTSEEARIKRRTLSTMDISAHECDHEIEEINELDKN